MNDVLIEVTDMDTGEVLSTINRRMVFIDADPLSYFGRSLSYYQKLQRAGKNVELRVSSFGCPPDPFQASLDFKS